MSYIISIIGAGVIGATISIMIYIINNNCFIIVFDINKKVSLENSNVVNNAGTGHEGMCENNYIIKKKKKFFYKKKYKDLLKI